MENRRAGVKGMRWTAGAAAVAAMIGITMAASPAPAIEVQGTWSASLSCKVFPADAPPVRDAEETTMAISQAGESIVLRFPEFFLEMVGFATDESADPAPATKGVIGVGTCSSGAVLGGIFARVKVDAAGGGSLRGTLSGVTFTGPVTCVVTARRTSAIDPGTPLVCP